MMIFILSSIVSYSQGYYYNGKFYSGNDQKNKVTNTYSNMFENYSISIGYERMKNDVFSSYPKYETDNLNINFMIYGVYVDASFSIGDSHSEYWNRYDMPHATNWGMMFGYSIPLVSKESDIRVFVTPMIGFTSTSISTGEYYYDYYWDEYHEVNDNYSNFNYGGAIGLSIHKLYLQGKITKNTIGGSIGVIF